MAFEKSEKPNFVYITYSRQNVHDTEKLKTELAIISQDKKSTKDVIIDFGTSKYLTSPEIGTIVRFANDVKFSSRIVRIIPSDELYKQFDTVNLTSIEHLTIYRNRQDFTEKLKSGVK
jgi:hypothetical protein